MTRRSIRATHLAAPRAVTRLLIAAIALGCADSPTSPHVIDAVPALGMTRITCTGDTQTRRVSCGDDATRSTSLAFAAVARAGGADRDVILGGQNQFIKLTSSNVAYVNAVFSFDVTVKNLILQSLGTTDGTTLAPAGVRVFFDNVPVGVGGTIDYTDPADGTTQMVDGFATFTVSNQAYYKYNEVLAPNQTSGIKNWRLHIPASVTSFSFFVFVSAPVQFPTGWIDLAPTSAGLRPGGSLTLVPTVRDVVGRILTGQTVTWLSTAPAVASVDASGGVLAISDGVTTIQADASGRPGTALITVASAVAANTTITGNPLSVTVGTPSTITVQAKNAANGNMTVGGDVVVLNASLGTLSSVTDNGNGTYTATLNSNVAGVSTITGTINTVTIGHPGTVTFTAAGATTMTINAGDAQTAAVGAAVAIAPSVLVKDQFNNPVSGAVVTFTVTGGGGSGTTLTPTTNSSGIATLGSWTLGAGGAGCSASTVTSCSRNALHAVVASGTNPSVDFKAYVPPIAPASALYAAVGNSTLTIGAPIGLLQDALSINGNGANGTGLTVTVTTPTPAGTHGGTATIATNGSFTYLSLPSYLSVPATDDFTYTVTDGVATTNTTPLLQVKVAQRVWYVQPGYAGVSTGADVTPYKDLSATAGVGVEVAAPVSEVILVRTGTGTATGGTLKAGQRLFGQGTSGGYTVAGFGGAFRNGATSYALLSAGTAPSVGALVLAANDTLSGLAITTSSAVGLTGVSFGTLIVSETSINSTTSGALSLTTGTVSGSFTTITSTGGTNNVLLSSVASIGTVALGTGALSGATGDAFKIVGTPGGTGSFTYAGTIANTTTLAVNIANKTGGTVVLSGNINPSVAGKGISVSSNSGGTAVTFSGTTKAFSTASANAVTLTNNTGATINFINGGLAIATTSGRGMDVTGGGTLIVTRNALSANTITSPSGTALNVNGTTIGVGGLVFENISSTGAAASDNGITLDNTGSTAGLTITGTGGAGSGGTISNKTGGGDGSTTQGSGIYLNSTVGVSLSWMQLSNFSNFGIRGTNVTGFSLLNSTINGNSGTTDAGAGAEAAIRFDGLFTSVAFPTATILNSTISGGYSENLAARNTTGTLDRFVVDNVTFGLLNDSGTNGNDSFAFEGSTGSTMKLTLTNSTFSGARGDIVNAAGHGGATMDVVLRQNKFYNTDTNTLSAGGGVTLSGGDNGLAAFTFEVTCNRFKGTSSSSLNIAMSSTSSGGSFSGTVFANVIGVVGSAFSGGSNYGSALWLQSHGLGTFTVRVQGNTIAEYGQDAIALEATDGSSILNATLLGNVLSNPDAAAQTGLHVSVGAAGTDAGTVNLLLGSQSVVASKNDFSAGDPINLADVTITQAGTTTLNLSTAGSVAGTVTAVIQDDNANPGTTTVSTPGGVGTLVASVPTLPGSFFSCAVTGPLMAAGGGCSTGSTVHVITDGEIAAVAAEAVARLGLTSPDVTFSTSVLPTGQLAEATARGILMSPTAAGWGWYVDLTPSDDAEFVDVVNASTGDHELHARPGGPADGRMDLLTTLMHELEHTLGRRDLHSVTAQHDLMAASLPAGVRRLPRAVPDTLGGSHE